MGIALWTESFVLLCIRKADVAETESCLGLRSPAVFVMAFPAEEPAVLSAAKPDVRSVLFVRAVNRGTHLPFPRWWCCCQEPGHLYVWLDLCCQLGLLVEQPVPVLPSGPCQEQRLLAQ